MNNRPLVILVGKSGSGKSSIARLLTTKYGYKEIKTFTTRQPRFDGEDTHIFITKEEYERAKSNNEIVAETQFDNNIYYTTIFQLNDSDVVIWDVNGAKYYLQNSKDMNYLIVYIDSSVIARIKNMRSRGDKYPLIIRRLLHDHMAFKYIDGIYDYKIKNNIDSNLIAIARRIELYVREEVLFGYKIARGE